uniref:Cerberus n=1 Tax=Pogona vitticeps TaxID=103695 RepID=A0A6J0SU67_9SAUR
MENKACVMHLLLLHILLISWLQTAEQCSDVHGKKRISHLPQELLMKYLTDEGTLAEPDLFVTDLMAKTARKNQDEPEESRYIFPHVVSHTAQGLGRQAPANPSPYPEGPRFLFPHPHSKRETDLFLRKDAKKFWNLFMLKTKSRSEETVLPIKTNEMYQDICNTLPFSQSIEHENCEKVVVQNNLCFGKCSSFHVPGLEDRLYTFCSHCLPTKFFVKHLEMNCTRTAPVIKVVMIVEECKCEVQKVKASEIGFLYSDLYANMYEHS